MFTVFDIVIIFLLGGSVMLNIVLGVKSCSQVDDEYDEIYYGHNPEYVRTVEKYGDEIIED